MLIFFRLYYMTEKLNFITDTKGIESTTLKQLNDAGIETIEDIDPMDADDIVENIPSIDHTTAFKIIKCVEEHKTTNKDEELKSKSVNVNESEDLDIEDDVSDTEEDFLEDIENEEAMDKYKGENETKKQTEKNKNPKHSENMNEEKNGLIDKIVSIFIEDDD